MNPEHAFFDVAPRLVPADCETSVTIRPLYDHVRLDPAIQYRVSCYPTDAKRSYASVPPQISSCAARCTNCAYENPCFYIGSWFC